jgi:SAM-dependent methyltransferase
VNPREYRALFEVEDRHWWFVALRREVAWTLRRNLPRGAPNRLRWLDAGCGTGGLLFHLAGQREAFRVGCDSSLEALDLARSRGLRGLVCGSAHALPFASGGFDAITSIDVLCHRGVRKEAALSEAFRCLAPGGVLILQVPAFDWLRSEHDDAVWTDRRFRRGEAETLLAGAGFAVRESFYRVGLLFPAAALRRLLARRRKGADARSDVRPAPFWLNALLGGVLRVESAIGAAGPRLPFGLSVFCVARKAAR